MQIALSRDSAHKNLLAQSKPAFTINNIEAHINAVTAFVNDKFQDPVFCNFVAKYRLDYDNVASIVMYTRQCGFFMALNGALRSQEDASIQCFAPFLRLLLTALSKLPCYEGDIVFRGMIYLGFHFYFY